MASYRGRAAIRFCCAAACTAIGVLFAVASVWFMSFVALYSASFLIWRGFRIHGKGIRLERERVWWSKAKKGVEQDPLDPCCTPFGETGFRHDEPSCTRYRYLRPKPITREERLEIDRKWNEIISHMSDPEYGEEA